MVGFALGNSGRFINEEWHERRQTAIETTYTVEEWSEIDITKYDLRDKDFTGKEVDRNYVFDHPISDDEVSVAGFDLRDLPTHD